MEARELKKVVLLKLLTDSNNLFMNCSCLSHQKYHQQHFFMVWFCLQSDNPVAKFYLVTKTIDHSVSCSHVTSKSVHLYETTSTILESLSLGRSGHRITCRDNFTNISGNEKYIQHRFEFIFSNDG